MANSRIPGPSGIHDYLTDSRGSSSSDDPGCHGGCIPGPAGIHYHRPIRVADADKKKPQKSPKAPPTPKPAETVKINTIIFHMYLPVGVRKFGDKLRTVSFSAQDFFDWIRGKRDDSAAGDGTIREWKPDYWEDLGIAPELKTSITTGVDDFKKSLQIKGAIVVYFGHSTLDQYHNDSSLGLTPHGNDKPEIPNSELRSLLGKSKAALVIIASCDSLTSVGKLSSGPLVIVTDSGPDHVTDSRDWANALGVFFFALIGLELNTSRQPTITRKDGHATVQEALDATVKVFEESKQADRFKLAHGDGSIKLIP